MSFTNYLNEIVELVDAKLSNLLPSVESEDNNRLVKAMRYSMMSPGKRIRPFLTIASANIFGVNKSCALQAAAAVEMVHAYSLIHDDLPSMDNDDIRRGMPSCHIKFDEATAILTGDALLTYAFEILADKETHPDSNVRCELIATLAKAIGWSGMVGGQILDISSNSNSTINEIIRMQLMKTGELFAVACEAGAILGKASRNLRIALRGYAHDVGLAFQIIDDLQDLKQDLNDNQQGDNKVLKTNYVLTKGVDKAKEQAKMLIQQAISHLNIFDHKADMLRYLANHIILKLENNG